MTTKYNKILGMVFVAVFAFGGFQTVNAQSYPYPSSGGSWNTPTTPVGSGTATPIPGGSWNASPVSCTPFYNNLSVGSRDYYVSGEVSRLQNFLIWQGYLSQGYATGYYGTMTAAAVARFQSNNGIQVTGGVGPITRAEILGRICGNGGVVLPPTNPYPPTYPPVDNQYYAPAITSISPSYGPFGTQVTIYGRNFNQYNNSINFGGVTGIVKNVPSYNGTSIQFTIPSSPCVQGSQVCTMIAFAPGQFPISVTNVAGTSNSVTFTATDGYNNGGGYNQPPTISSIEGPNSLGVRQSGVWKVNATSNNGQLLNYSVVWGDEGQYNATGLNPYPQSNGLTSSATFEHVYNTPGTYTPTFTVRDSNGQTVKASVTVQVTNGGSSYNAPVITSISPTSGQIGTVVTVSGSNFSRYDNFVNFAGVNRAITNVESVDGRTLKFTIPGTPCTVGNYCAQVVLPSGVYPITIGNSYGTSNALYFNLTQNGGNGTTTQSVNTSFTLALGESKSVNNGDLTIRPISIIEDSRCPVGIQCFQAGRVVVQTQIKSPSVNYQNVPVSSSWDGKYTSPEGYVIRVTSVEPAKYVGQSINDNAWRITYEVTR